MCRFHFHDVINIPIISPKAIAISIEFTWGSIPMGMPIPMHTSTLRILCSFQMDKQAKFFLFRRINTISEAYIATFGQCNNMHFQKFWTDNKSQ